MILGLNPDDLEDDELDESFFEELHGRARGRGKGLMRDRRNTLHDPNTHLSMPLKYAFIFDKGELI